MALTQQILGKLRAHVEDETTYVHEGDLLLSAFDTLTVLPSLKINGNLDLIGLMGLVKMGESIEVSGTLTLDEIPLLDHLPPRIIANTIILKNLTLLKEVGDEVVCKCLHVESCASLVSIPQTLLRCKSLTLKNCADFTSFRPSSNHWLFEDVRIQGCQRLKTLPDGFGAQHNLKLIDLPNLQRLPNHIFVGSELRVTGCGSLKEIGHHALAMGDVVIEKCGNIVLPTDFYCEGTISIDSAVILPSPQVLKDYKVKLGGVDIGKVVYPVEKDWIKNIMEIRDRKKRWAAIEQWGAERYLKASGIRFTNIPNDPFETIKRIEKGEKLYDFYFISLGKSKRAYDRAVRVFSHLPNWNEGAILNDPYFKIFMENYYSGRLNN